MGPKPPMTPKLGDDGPEDFVVSDGQGHFLFVDHVVGQPFCKVIAGSGDKEAGASLPQVHLEELVGVVPGIQLDVEICKAHIADVF